MVHLTTALDAASGVPLYEQLYRSLAAEMRTGAISAGTRMPGKRRLAAELSVSVNTVDAAYQMLAAEGYLESPAARVPLRISPARLRYSCSYSGTPEEASSAVVRWTINYPSCLGIASN